jgi:transposase
MDAQGGAAMARPLLDDELWSVIEPLLPPPKPRRFKFPGRKPLDRRKALTGILFVLKTGIPWEYLPQEMGCGCGMSCWRYLDAWQKAGVWETVHKVLLDRLRAEEEIDLSAAVVDSSHVRAVGGAKKRGPALWIEGKRGRNTTSSRMRKAFRLPFDSRAATATT